MQSKNQSFHLNNPEFENILQIQTRCYGKIYNQVKKNI